MMQKLIGFISLFALFIASTAYSDIDTNQLNNYSSPKTSGQNININNNTLNTGMLQHTTILPNGDIEGINQQGHHWYYEKKTNTYYNYETGKICKGTGGLMSECNK